MNEYIHGLRVRYDESSDVLTVTRPHAIVHTAIATAHDSVIAILRDECGIPVGVTLHQARGTMPADWIVWAYEALIPTDLRGAVAEWLRRHSLARAVLV